MTSAWYIVLTIIVFSSLMLTIGGWKIVKLDNTNRDDRRTYIQHLKHILWLQFKIEWFQITRWPKRNLIIIEMMVKSYLSIDDCRYLIDHTVFPESARGPLHDMANQLENAQEEGIVLDKESKKLVLESIRKHYAEK